MIVGVTKTFLKDIEKFSDKEKILDAVRDLKKLKTLSESVNFRKMTGTTNRYRMRLGKYRIALTWHKDKQELIAERVALRKDMYKKK
jgi:mRNA interferase RelE/StbE